MLFNWEPGERINRLPIFLRPLALLWRNIRYFTHNVRLHRAQTRLERSASGKEIAKHLAMAVEYVEGSRVKGDIVEFGTDTGFTAGVLAQHTARTDRSLCLFDSFEGLPDATSEVDRNCPCIAQEGLWGQGECRGLSERQLRRRCKRWMPDSRLLTMPGWYCDTVPEVSGSMRFALLHVDCDLFQSTLDALAPLFQRRLVSTGCIILFDDWNCNASSPEFGQKKAWAVLVEKYNIRASDEGPYGWRCRKFIVLSYSGIDSHSSTTIQGQLETEVS